MPKKILIVDDEADLVEILKSRFESMGYAVVSACDGQDALKKVRRDKPDLIILDIMMPRMDGHHICRVLKFDAKFRDIPIIMLTARGQEQDKITAQQVGADAYMTKPFDSKALLAKIEELIGK